MEILDLLDQSLEETGLSEKSVVYLASIEAKSDEVGLLEAAKELGVPLRFYAAEELASRRRRCSRAGRSFSCRNRSPGTPRSL